MLKDRFLLDESRLNGRKLNKEAKPFLLEMEGGMSYFDRCKTDPNLPLYLVGIIQSGDKPNRNNRIYPWQTLKRECLRYMENEVKTKRAFGELDHPADSSVPELKTASHIIEDMWFKDKDVYARVKVLNAYTGPGDTAYKLRSLILNGCNVGISSRALGSLEEQTMQGYDVVGDDLEFACWDVVSNASNFGSEVMDFTESKTKKKNSRLLTEAQCIGPHCNIGSKVSTIEQLRFHELTEEEKTYLNILGVERFIQISKSI